MKPRRRSGQGDPSASKAAGGQSSSMNLRSSRHSKASITDNLETSDGEGLLGNTISLGNSSSARSVTRVKNFARYSRKSQVKGMSLSLYKDRVAKDEGKRGNPAKEKDADEGHVIDDDDEDDDKTLDWVLGKPSQHKRKASILSSNPSVGLQGKRITQELNGHEGVKDHTNHCDDKQDNMTLDCLLGKPFRRKERVVWLSQKANEKASILERKVDEIQAEDSTATGTKKAIEKPSYEGLKDLMNNVDDKQDNVTLDCLFGKPFRRKVKAPVLQQKAEKTLQTKMVGQDHAEDCSALRPLEISERPVREEATNCKISITQKIRSQHEEVEDIFDVVNKEEATPQNDEFKDLMNDNIDRKCFAFGECSFVGEVHKMDALSQGKEILSVALIDGVVKKAEALDSLKDGIDRKCTASGDRSFVRGAPKVDVPSQVIETLSMPLIDGFVNKEEVTAPKNETEDSSKDDIGRTCVALGECSFAGDTHDVDVSSPGLETLSITLIDGVVSKEEVTAPKDESEDFIEDIIGRNCAAFGECSRIEDDKVGVSTQGIETLLVAPSDCVVNKEEATTLHDEADDSIEDKIGRKCVALREQSFVGDDHKLDISSRGIETLPAPVVDGDVTKEEPITCNDEAGDDTGRKLVASGENSFAEDAQKVDVSRETIETLSVTLIDGDICKVDLSSQRVETLSVGAIDGDVYKVDVSSPGIETMSMAVIDDNVHKVDVSNQGVETVSVVVLDDVASKEEATTQIDELEDSIKDRIHRKCIASGECSFFGSGHKVDVSSQSADRLPAAVFDGVVYKEEVKALKDEATIFLKDDIDRKCMSFGESSIVGDAHKVDVSSQGVVTLSVALTDGVANTKKATAQKDEVQDSVKDDVDRKCVVFGEFPFVRDAHKVDVSNQEIETLSVTDGVNNKEEVIAWRDEANDYIQDDIDRSCVVASGECSFVGDAHKVDILTQGINSVSVALIGGVADKEEATTWKNDVEDSMKNNIHRTHVTSGQCSFVGDACESDVSSQGVALPVILFDSAVNKEEGTTWKDEAEDSTKYDIDRKHVASGEHCCIGDVHDLDVSSQGMSGAVIPDVRNVNVGTLPNQVYSRKKKPKETVGAKMVPQPEVNGVSISECGKSEGMHFSGDLTKGNGTGKPTSTSTKTEPQPELDGASKSETGRSQGMQHSTELTKGHRIGKPKSTRANTVPQPEVNDASISETGRSEGMQPSYDLKKGHQTRRPKSARARMEPKFELNGASISDMGRSERIQCSSELTKGHRSGRPKRVIQTDNCDSQRTLRQVQKRKHNELAYEANLELDALLGDLNSTDCNGKGVLKSKDHFSALSSDQAVAGETAAIAAGLKACALTPIEKIRFKDVLKRRGGLQEYLDCRNMVLHLWERDIKHILSATDCGLSSVSTPGESPRAALIREAYDFLNLHGYINIGLAKEKLRLSSDEEGIKPVPKTAAVGESFPAILKGVYGDAYEQVRLERDLKPMDLQCAKVAEGNLGQAAIDKVVVYRPQNVEVKNKSISRTSSQSSELSDDKPLASFKERIGNARSGSRRKRELEGGEFSKPSKKGSGIGATTLSAAKTVLNESIQSARGGNNLLLDGTQSDAWNNEASVEKRDLHQVQNPFLEDVFFLPSTSLCNYNAQKLDTIDAKNEVTAERMEKRVILDSMSGVCSSYESEAPHTCEHTYEEWGSKKGLPNFDSCELQANVSMYGGITAAENRACLTNDKHNVKQRHVVVVGAGPAGLIAARHLQRMNFRVTVLEARKRIGGRAYTDSHTFSVPVDLGASIITGVEADIATERRADPSALLCRQLGLRLTTLRGDCPLYDSVTGSKVPADLDTALEAEFNSLLDDTVALVAQTGDAAMQMSLEEGLEQALKKRKTLQRCNLLRIDKSLNGSITDTVTKIAATKSSEDNGHNHSSKMHDAKTGSLKSSNSVTVAGVPESANARLTDSSSEQKIFRGKLSNHVAEQLIRPHNSLSKLEKESKLSLASHAVLEDACNLNRRIMDWHFANLEYGCAAELNKVSLPFWNQDDVYGGFGGPHCMIKEGYGSLMGCLGEGLDIRLGQAVTEIRYSSLEFGKSEEFKREVKVKTKSGEEFIGDAVLVTIPLGCLKADTIKFLPSLPNWKLSSIKKLGFGVLNKVVLEFANVFWDETVDYFGATAESTASRGRCFMFWNLKRMVDAPILVALVVGKAALEGEKVENAEQVGHALGILRKLYGEKTVPEPLASAVTNWGSDQYCRGAYSYVAMGASGEDYDIIGRPVENCLFFAGEATCKEYPDTVGGAIISGIREAVRIVDILENGEDLTKEAETMEVEQGESEREKNEVRNIIKRLSAADLSNVLLGDTAKLEGELKPISRADLLKDMFGDAKTTAARILLAKEMLQQPISMVGSIAGTKAGLTVLNSWILDSLGKNGTQLLRHCVHLLLLVATNLVSVRQSGVGRTVKEKLCVHTSRDVRAIAGQLVKMWFEIFQREKSRQKLSSPLKSANAIPEQEKSRQTLYSPFKRASTSTDEQNSEKLLECKAKNIAKSPLRSKSHFALEPKAPASVKLTSTVGSSCNNNLGKQALTTDDLENSETLLDVRRSSCKEGIENLVGEQMASKLETNPLVAAKVAKAAAEACAAVEGQSSTLPVLPEIVPFHKFARREKFSVKVATVDWKNRRRPDVRSPCFSSLSSGKALTALHVGLQKVNEWSLDLTGTCGNFDSLDTGGFEFYEDHVSPTDTNNASTRMEDIDDEQRRLQSEDAKAEHVADAKAENSFKDLTNDLSLLRDKCSLRDSLDEECEDRSVCGPENTVDRRNSALEFPIFQAQPVVNMIKLMPDKIEAVNKVDIDSEKLLDVKPSRTSEENICLEKIKRAVSDYVANLLTPLYKTRKIQKDDYKLIVKKTVAKVMERDAPQGTIPDVTDFLNSKRKTKIRALVDRYIEMQMSPPQSRDGLSSAPS